MTAIRQSLCEISAMLGREHNGLILLHKFQRADPPAAPAAVAKLPVAADFAGPFTRH
jgi:hypothetical protein